MSSSGYQEGPLRKEFLLRVQAALEQALCEEFGGDRAPAMARESVVLLRNESHLHNVPATAELHFNITIASDLFGAAKYANRLARHRFVYGAAGDLMLPSTATANSVGIHMLRIHCFTLDEWRERGGATEVSPPCLGGMAPS